jgi:hypothetical protein
VVRPKIYAGRKSPNLRYHSFAELFCADYNIQGCIKYDYVGEPMSSEKNKEWKNLLINDKNPRKGDEVVGNGGLSLRKKSKMLEIIRKCPIKTNGQTYLEDLYFSLPCPDVENYKKPDTDESKNFSIENHPNDKSFGVHKPWGFIDIHKHLGEWCPESVELQKLHQ